MIWNESKECINREQMRKLQGERLRKLVEKVYHNTPFYRKKMQEMGLLPEDIKTIDDIVKLPFTTKQDLRDNYPFKLFAVPMSEIVRLHASSGTTGNPTVVGYTRRDISVWSEAIARCLSAYGIDRNDVVTVAYGYGLFTGGLGVHYGVEHVGATVVPTSVGNSLKHIQLIKDFNATAIACTPSYALYLSEQLKKEGVRMEDVKLKVGIMGAEPWTENMRREIEEKLGIDAYNIYGLSEIMGPGVSYECERKDGSHISEDHFYPEIVSPETLEQQEEGEVGELVFTTLTKEGIPLLRYRTKDLCSLNYAECECGRTNVRMGRILGRSDDMLIIRGVNLFPSQIEAVILDLEEFEPHYMLVVDRVNNLDTLEIQVELKEEYYSDEVNKLVEIKKRLTTRLQSVIGISAGIKLMEPGVIERSQGKAKRVIDNRVFE